jgi:hypothetical protein
MDGERKINPAGMAQKDVENVAGDGWPIFARRWQMWGEQKVCAGIRWLCGIA